MIAATAAPMETEHARAVVLQMNDMIGEAISARDTLVRLYSLGGEFLAAPYRGELPTLPPGLPPLADLDTDAPAAKRAPVRRKPAPKRTPKYPRIARVGPAPLDQFRPPAESAPAVAGENAAAPTTAAPAVSNADKLSLLDRMLSKFGRVTEETRKASAAMIALPKAFNATALAEALDLEMKAAYSTLHRFRERGILENCGMGLYRIAL